MVCRGLGCPASLLVNFRFDTEWRTSAMATFWWVGQLCFAPLAHISIGICRAYATLLWHLRPMVHPVILFSKKVYCD